MNLRYGGRPVPGFGVGAAPDIGAGIAALKSALTKYSGEGGYSPPPAPVAVSGLKAAGNAAVNAVGPAIDALSGNDPTVMKKTQSVWQKNGELANVNGSGNASQADVDTAKAIVNQMIFAYMEASNLVASRTPADADQGTATSRVNIPTAPAPRLPTPRSRLPTPRSGGSSTPSPPPSPAAAASLAPSADDGTSTTTWIAVGVGVLVLAVGGVVVATRRAA